MKNIDPSIIAALRSSELRPFYLLDMSSLASIFVFTDCDVPIKYTTASYGTVNYTPRSFTFTSMNVSAARLVNDVTIEIDNMITGSTAGYFSTHFIGGTPQGTAVNLYLVLTDAQGATLGTDAVVLFNGAIDSWGISEDKLTMTLTSDMIKWTQKTLNRHNASCRWKVFKGTECTYSGAATECDRSYARCSALSNTDNFGGFRWLPGLIGKELWWGRTQGEQ